MRSLTETDIALGERSKARVFLPKPRGGGRSLGHQKTSVAPAGLERTKGKPLAVPGLEALGYFRPPLRGFWDSLLIRELDSISLGGCGSPATPLNMQR